MLVRFLLISLGLAAMATAAVPEVTATVNWDANPETDIAGYKVFLGSSSGNYSVILDVTTNSSILSGLIPNTTYYCAVQAYNTSGLSSELSKEVEFVAETTPLAYADWIAAANLSGTDALAGAAPSGDGVSNLLKYAFNMNPSAPDCRVLASGTGTVGLPSFSLDNSGAQPQFKVEFLRRRNSGLVYSPKVSADLATFSAMTGTSLITVIDSDWEIETILMPVSFATTPRLFGKVEVTLP